MSEPGLSRRQRVRAATEEEIRRTGRKLLSAGGPSATTLRAVAREMGMTAPALYRYLASHEELIALVTLDCYDELIATMLDARDAVDADDPIGRLLVVSRTFRRWSLDHPQEFGVVFANPLASVLEATEDRLQSAGQRFGGVFAELFGHILRSYDVSVPDEDELDPRYAAQLARIDKAVAGRMPLGWRYVFVTAWIRLYGCVCLEVFGHIDWALADSEPLFEDTLRHLSALMGVAEHYRRPPSTAESRVHDERPGTRL